MNNQEIDTFYNKLCKDLFDISCKSIPLSNLVNHIDHIIYIISRSAHVVQRVAGKPHDGQTPDDMNAPCLRFNLICSSQCKLIDETARGDSMARSLRWRRKYYMEIALL